MKTVRAAWGTTPGRYRVWSVVVAALLAWSALAATVSAASMRSGTHHAEANSGPVLVSTQLLVADLAEADAAATAAFLSGANEDPDQRRTYEQALGRANEQIEDIASLAGDDPGTHRDLQAVSVDVTRYAGLVEAGRASNASGAGGATGYLVQAVNLANRIVQTESRQLAAATQARLARDEASRTRGYPAAIVALVVALLALVVAQVSMARRSRRILNLPLVAAMVLVVVALGWLVAAERRGAAQIRAARAHGYDSLVLTKDLQTTAFEAKADETLALITSDPATRQAATAAASKVSTAPIDATTVTAIRASTGGGSGLIGDAAAVADTARERAAVADMAVRWQRYRDTAAQLASAPNAAAARDLAVGPASSTFNGFNFSVEAVVGQNQDQFAAGLRTAAKTASRVPAVALLLPIGALLLVFAGFQLRIREYR